MKKLLYLLFLLGAFTQAQGQNNTVYGAGISYTNGAPSFTPPARTSRVAIDTITGKWYHYNTPGGWQLLGNTIEEIAGCSAPAYTPTKGDSRVVINNCTSPELYYWTGSAWVWINEGTTYYAGEGIRIENDTIILDSLELNELHDVFVPNPINNQVLTWNNLDKRWEAKTVADSSATNELQTLSTTGTAGNISISSGNTITLNVNDADASPTNELQTLSVAANTATLSAGGGSVTIAGAGINTVGTAGTTITVTGTEVDGSVSNELQTLSTGTNTLTLSNGGGTVTVDTDPASDITGSGVSGRVPYFNGTQTVTSSDNLQYSDIENGRLSIGGSNTGKLNINRNAGDNIFNQTLFSSNPGHGNYWWARRSRSDTYGTQLETQNGDVLGVMYFSGVNNVNSSAFGSSIIVAQSAAAGTFVPSRISLVTYSATGANTSQLVLNSTGNVGLGISAPAARLHVVGSGSTSTTWTAQFHNSLGNNNALMIRNDGIVSIGTASPNDSGALEISSTTRGVLFPRMTTAQRNAITTPADGLVIYNTTDNKLQVRAAGVWVDLH